MGTTEAGSLNGYPHNETSVTLVRSEVRGNTADEGAGIFNYGIGVVNLMDSHVRANAALSRGGGILSDGDSDTVTLDADSSVTGNTPDDCVGTQAC